MELLLYGLPLFTQSRRKSLKWQWLLSHEFLEKDKKILNYNHNSIFAATDLLLEKNFECNNNPEKSSTKKETNKHKASYYLLFTHCSSDSSKSKYIFYRSADCMKNLDLKEKTTEIFNYEKKKMLSLTSRVNHTIVKDFLISSRTSFMMLMIAMMIVVMMYLTPEKFVMIL